MENGHEESKSGAGAKASDTEAAGRERAKAWRLVERALAANRKHAHLSALIADSDRVSRRAGILGRDPARTLQGLSEKRARLVKQIKLNQALLGGAGAAVTSLPSPALNKECFKQAGKDRPPWPTWLHPEPRQPLPCDPVWGYLGANGTDFGPSVVNVDERDNPEDGIGTINTVAHVPPAGYTEFNGTLTADTDPFDDDLIDFGHTWELSYAFPTDSYSCPSRVFYAFQIEFNLKIQFSAVDFGAASLWVAGFEKPDANVASPLFRLGRNPDGTISPQNPIEGFFHRNLLTVGASSQTLFQRQAFQGTLLVGRSTPSRLFLLLGVSVVLKDGTATIDRGSFLVGEVSTWTGGSLEYRVSPDL